MRLPPPREVWEATRKLEFCIWGDACGWNQYVAKHPHATQYHQYEWLTLIEEAFHQTKIPLAAVSEGRLVGILPVVMMSSALFGRFAVSLPFVNYGGLLADDAFVEESLWEHAADIVRRHGARYLEARHVAPRLFIRQKKRQKVSMILELATDADSQWKGFNAKLRNQIRKAEKSGLRCRVGAADEAFRFYSVFARCMRSLGTPVYDPRFFERVLETFREAASVLVVEDGGRPVAAGIALEYRDVLELPWAGSLPESRPKCPNNMLYWEAIQHAIKRGLRRFDFGRSTPGDGPYRFKEQWGAKPLPLTWEYWLADGQDVPDLSPRNEKFHAMIEVWKRLPLWVTTRLGPRIVRGIP